MEQTFDLTTLHALLASAVDWAQSNILSWRVALQLLILAATFLVARLVSARLSPLLERRLAALDVLDRVALRFEVEPQSACEVVLVLNQQ